MIMSSSVSRCIHHNHHHYLLRRRRQFSAPSFFSSALLASGGGGGGGGAAASHAGGLMAAACCFFLKKAVNPSTTTTTTTTAALFQPLSNLTPRRLFSASAGKVSSLSLTSKKRKGHKISVVTAYDFPSAIHIARAGIDVLLVGDSVGMVELGHATTQPVTMTDMIHHCQAVSRGVDHAIRCNGGGAAAADAPPPLKAPLLVGDMPFGSYEFENTDIALENAYRFVKEAGMDAVKLEGGSPARARTAQRIVQDGGIAVMGHVGLTPQSISVMGGFRAQGRTAVRARHILDAALRLQDAGVFSIVIECVPPNVAQAITETLEIPTIGIGAGPHCSGQVLVFHDMLGMTSHPHHSQFVPKFCKRYAQIGHLIQEGLSDFKQDVEKGDFPSDEYCPYTMKEEEQVQFAQLLQADAQQRQEQHEAAAKQYTETDEYEKLALYGQQGAGQNGSGGKAAN